MEKGNKSKRQQPNQSAEKKAEGHYWGFNTARKFHNQRHASAGSKQKCVLLQ